MWDMKLLMLFPFFNATVIEIMRNLVCVVCSCTKWESVIFPNTGGMQTCNTRTCTHARTNSHKQTNAHDGSCPHVSAQIHFARIGTPFLEAENIPVLPWPAYSPDIEHVWDALNQSVRQRVPVPANIQQLRTQPLKRSGTTFHNQQPGQLYAKKMCRTAWGKWWSHQMLTGFLICDGICDQQMHICIPSLMKHVD